MAPFDWRCTHCEKPIGRTFPSRTKGKRYLSVPAGSWGEIVPESEPGEPRMIRCKGCGKLTPWRGEIVLLEAA